MNIYILLSYQSYAKIPSYHMDTEILQHVTGDPTRDLSTSDLLQSYSRSNLPLSIYKSFIPYILYQYLQLVQDNRQVVVALLNILDTGKNLTVFYPPVSLICEVNISF